MKASNFDIDNLIEALEGTCSSLDETINSMYPGMEVEDLTEEDHDEIDSRVFRCDTCSWWYDISEKVDDENCDCIEDEDEDS